MTSILLREKKWSPSVLLNLILHYSLFIKGVQYIESGCDYPTLHDLTASEPYAKRTGIQLVPKRKATFKCN